MRDPRMAQRSLAWVIKMNGGAFTWKGSRFQETLPGRLGSAGHTMPDIGSQISPNRTNSRKWTEQTALRPTDSRLLTLAEARSSDLTLLESPAMPVSDLSL